MHRSMFLATIAAVTLGWATSILAAPQAKTYQATGPVLEVADNKVVIQKGDEKWEIALDAGAKVTGELKVGAKVTVEYRMVATKVDVKATEAKAE